MRTLKTLVTAMTAAMILVGCRADYANVRVGPKDKGQPFDGTLAVGEKVDVRVDVVHPELEGSTSLQATSLDSSDSSIVRTEIGGQGFYLIGVAPGTVTLHAETSGFPDAGFVVTVK